jgi:hypothetical protein
MVVLVSILCPGGFQKFPKIAVVIHASVAGPSAVQSMKLLHQAIQLVVSALEMIF